MMPPSEEQMEEAHFFVRGEVIDVDRWSERGYFVGVATIHIETIRHGHATRTKYVLPEGTIDVSFRYPKPFNRMLGGPWASYTKGSVVEAYLVENEGEISTYYGGHGKEVISKGSTFDAFMATGLLPHIAGILIIIVGVIVLIVFRRRPN